MYMRNQVTHVDVIVQNPRLYFLTLTKEHIAFGVHYVEFWPKENFVKSLRFNILAENQKTL